MLLLIVLGGGAVAGWLLLLVAGVRVRLVRLRRGKDGRAGDERLGLLGRLGGRGRGSDLGVAAFRTAGLESAELDEALRANRRTR
mgnify:CR=1 FL=1